MIDHLNMARELRKRAEKCWRLAETAMWQTTRERFEQEARANLALAEDFERLAIHANE